VGGVRGHGCRSGPGDLLMEGRKVGTKIGGHDINGYLAPILSDLSFEKLQYTLGYVVRVLEGFI
jgi:hypothetical protein